MLNVDKFFYESLHQSAEVMVACEGRIFNPARPEIDEEEDKIPYIIITYNGGASDMGCKDERLSTLTSATVSVLCVADDRDALANLTELVADTIDKDFETEDLYEVHLDWNFYIDSASMSAGAVEMDPMKPCCFQTLTYQCETSKR